jgi:hypothetical protein
MTAADRVYLSERVAEAEARGANYWDELTHKGYVSLRNEGWDSLLNRNAAGDLRHWYNTDLNLGRGGAGGTLGGPIGGGGRGLGTAGVLGGAFMFGLGLSSQARAGEYFPEPDDVNFTLPGERRVMRLSDLRSTGMTSIDAADADDGSQDEGAEKPLIHYTSESLVIAGREARPSSWAATLADTVRRWFGSPRADISRGNAFAHPAGPARRDAGAGDRFRRESQASTRPSNEPRVRVFVKSLGRSTGEAFRVIVVNDGTEPVEIVPDFVVLEPVKGVDAAAIERELATVPTARKGEFTMNAYCLQFQKKPPAEGQVYRIAPAAKQQRASSTRRILQASSALAWGGLLSPDSAPLDYAHSIRQWAIWTEERRLTERTFTESFVEYSRKAIEAGGRSYTPAVEAALRQLAPNRWRDITRVLAEAPYWAAPRPEQAR